jgi:hypothetical protein
MSRAESGKSLPSVLGPALLVVVLLGAVVTGCQGKASDEPASSGTDPTISESGDPSESTADGASPAPAVEPATGPRLETPHARARAPEGWGRRQTAFGVDSQMPGGSDAVTLSEGPAPPGAEPTRGALRAAAKGQLQLGLTRNPSLDLDAKLAGRPAFKLTGHDRHGRKVQWTTIYEDSLVTISFLLQDTPKAEREELVESVLSTFEYR